MCETLQLTDFFSWYLCAEHQLTDLGENTSGYELNRAVSGGKQLQNCHCLKFKFCDECSGKYERKNFQKHFHFTQMPFAR